MAIFDMDLVEVAGVNPARSGRHKPIVERRLRSLLLPLPLVIGI